MKELSVSLTSDQDLALNKMSDWVNSPVKDNNDLFYTLVGGAGVGKTFLLKYFIEVNNLFKLVITAPTHKAKKVAAKATGFNAATIQSLLGLRPDVNMDFFDINRPAFNPLADETIKDWKYVIIDECSMVNISSFNLIVDRAIKYGVRIIFVGDWCQALPIGEGLSKVFTAVKNISELTTIVRQNETNPNLVILKLLRQDIKYKTVKALQYIYKNHRNVNEKGEGYICYHPNHFTKALVEEFCKTEAMYDTDFIKYIAYTNRSVASACRGIRGKVVGEESSNLLVKQDPLIGYNTISIMQGKYFVTTLQNSEDYSIDSIIDSETDYGIKAYYAKLTTSEGNNTGIHIVKEESYEDFLTIFRQKLSVAKAKRGRFWRYYYDFKNTHLTMKDFYYPSGKLELKKDLYYGYGITSHKAQGSTYGNVAINIKNMLGIRNPDERNRLIYVALSRTSNLNILNI